MPSIQGNHVRQEILSILPLKYSSVHEMSKTGSSDRGSICYHQSVSAHLHQVPWTTYSALINMDSMQEHIESNCFHVPSSHHIQDVWWCALHEEAACLHFSKAQFTKTGVNALTWTRCHIVTFQFKKRIKTAVFCKNTSHGSYTPVLMPFTNHKVWMGPYCSVLAIELCRKFGV